jgi:hypothetical protein
MNKPNYGTVLTLALVGLFSACAPNGPSSARAQPDQQSVLEVVYSGQNTDNIYRLRFANGDRCYYINGNAGRVALSCIPAYMTTAGEAHNPQPQ